MYKLGKKAPRRLASTPAFGDFLSKATEWPAVAAQGWEPAVPASALSILGNDLWGCCAEAGAMHYAQVQSYNVGRPLIPTTEETLELYSALTGFNINAGPSGENPTDQGTDLLSLLQYWQKTGISIGGKLHQIVGYASLDITSLAQMRYATYLFGGSYLGINCPDACQQNTSNWNFAPGLPIEGGHSIIRAGQGADGGVTGSWGMWIPTSNSFYLGYLDEGYIVVTPDWVNAQNEAPSGVDLNGLLNAMKAL